MAGIWRARLFAAVMLLPLVVFATAPGGAWLRCRTTGAILSACCCDDGAASAKAPPLDAVDAAGCCDRIEQTVTSAPAEPTAAPEVAPVPLPAIAALPASLDAASAPATTALRFDARSSVGPPTGRSRLLAKSTFLI